MFTSIMKHSLSPMRYWTKVRFKGRIVGDEKKYTEHKVGRCDLPSDKEFVRNKGLTNGIERNLLKRVIS